MIAALFALAAAMIIGGAAAVVQGFPYVRLESGLAMVISGSVAASSGAILLGLGVVAAGLRRVERRVGASAVAQAAEPAISTAESRPRLPPVPIPPVPVPRPSAAEPAVPAQAEPQLPMPGLTPPAEPASEHPSEAAAVDRPAEPAPAGATGIAPEDDLFAAPAAPDDARLRPSLDAAGASETGALPAAAPEPVAKPERTVVGRYSSGGNTYVMFDDGAIEAETPNGRFTFTSLDELKAFVDAGGESGARGAA